MADVIKFMDDIGFVAYDICSFIRRPLDKALWQPILFSLKRITRLSVIDIGIEKPAYYFTLFPAGKRGGTCRESE